MTEHRPAARRIGRRSVLGLAGLGLAGWTLGGCAPAGGPQVVRTATYLPESYDDLYPGVQILTDTLAARSGGTLTCDTFHSGTLLGAEQLIPGLLLGVADLVVQTSSYVSSTFPVLGAMELPFGTDDFARRRRALDPAGPLYALVNAELAAQNVRLIGGMPCTFEYLWTVDRPILVPDDARGLRLRVAGEIEGETVKALGAAPVFMGSSEVFEALERGTIDGLVSYVGTVFSRDLQEIVRYGTVARFGAYTVDAYCRADWYAAQPPPVRAALDAAGAALHAEGTDVMLRVTEGDFMPAVAEAGVELIAPGPAELAAFQEAVRPVQQRWREMVGDPAVADRALRAIESA